MSQQSGTLSTIERAIQLASEGSCKSVEDIRRQLQREKYEAVDQHTSGPAFRKKLKELMAAARAA